MKKVIPVSILCAFLTGCDYTVRLVTSPNLDIDKSAVGLWQRTKGNGETENLLILPLSEKEYMLSFPAGSKEAMFARACFWRGSGMLLVQVDWFGTAQAKLPTDNRTYQYASYAVDADSMTIRLLNTDVVPKDITTAKVLSKAIADNRNNPDLFRNEMVFTKVPQ